jgi:hemoglobin/transferrin/lactoferrin receptor protein
MTLDFFYVRLERESLGWFDHGSFTYSLNSQREERVNQGGNGNPRATIGHEPERTTANGLNASFERRLSERASLHVGGEAYFEKLTSDSFDVNPTTGVESPRRPRVPSGATYLNGGSLGADGVRRGSRPASRRRRAPLGRGIVRGEGFGCADRQRPAALA